MSNPDNIKLDDDEYVKVSSLKNEMAEKLDGMKYVIIRTYSAGVHAGYLESTEDLKSGLSVMLRKSRRLWYWDGASSLSQLAIDGTSKPENCKFPCEVDKITLTNVIEVIECTEKAKSSIGGVGVWEQ